MYSSLQGMQRASSTARAATSNLAAPGVSSPEMRPADSLRDIVDISKAARGMQASAVVFSVAADMADAALAIGSRLDRLA